ncbi:PREDICTED: hematopoietic prostaglandin D synthase-like [Chinchilla lanigera]|uniref:hematopoietic prostaglandin D synthase-like n=1 Tax=Chinchilla lanigera TaxID=34839 RepID=UPI00038EC0C0|nr:PREDICTED: hematopoietic prostaglandin D synthase-like [Chinchilla lanigera]
MREEPAPREGRSGKGRAQGASLHRGTGGHLAWPREGTPGSVNPSQVFNELLTREAPHLLQDLETYLGDKEWLTGNSVTWADFYWDICNTTLLVFKPDLLDSHPRLGTLRKKVQAIPRIAAWVQYRPQTRL